MLRHYGDELAANGAGASGPMTTGPRAAATAGDRYPPARRAAAPAACGSAGRSPAPARSSGSPCAATASGSRCGSLALLLGHVSTVEQLRGALRERSGRRSLAKIMDSPAGLAMTGPGHYLDRLRLGAMLSHRDARLHACWRP